MYCQLPTYVFYSYIYFLFNFEKTYVEVFYKCLFSSYHELGALGTANAHGRVEG